ncbi:hypothetical protein GCM10019060_12690 [Novosphingobium pokkalii]|nr:hypothetical protein GCM10019060_12690 [Novosphingobium pokkalii]
MAILFGHQAQQQEAQFARGEHAAPAAAAATTPAAEAPAASAPAEGTAAEGATPTERTATKAAIILVKAAGKARRDMGGKAVSELSAATAATALAAFVAVKSAKHAPFGAVAVKSHRYSFHHDAAKIYLKCISTSPAAKFFEKFSPRLSISVGDGRSVCPASPGNPARPAA